MNMLIDTCVLPRSRLETAKIYRERFGPSLGFELLMMFDLPDFERNLKSNLELFQEGLLIFHEPVWNCEPSAPKGSPVWEESMWHLRLTRKYAAILHPKAMVCHLNNQPVPPEKKDTRLRTALENLEEKREMFPDVRILVENTGTMADGSMMLDQEEFTQLCREQAWPVMIDVGHAPIVSEVIQADIAIKTNQPDLRVWGVNAEGYYVGKLATTYEDGWLKFHVGENFPASHYLIMAE